LEVKQQEETERLMGSLLGVSQQEEQVEQVVVEW
jgi:hypothetical protein